MFVAPMILIIIALQYWVAYVLDIVIYGRFFGADEADFKRDVAGENKGIIINVNPIATISFLHESASTSMLSTLRI